MMELSKPKWDQVKSNLILVECWCRDGLLEVDIARKLGIGVSTLSKYKVDHIELREALKRGKEVVDFLVENALLKRALGYNYDEITQELVAVKNEEGEIIYNLDGSIKKELQVTKVVTKEVIPDVTAQIYWTKNRKPKAWRDKQDIAMIAKIPIRVRLVKTDE
jgi:hypothetical protein